MTPSVTTILRCMMTDIADVVSMLDTARKLCRQSADLLVRTNRIGWSEEPYRWDMEISEYLFVMKERLGE